MATRERKAYFIGGRKAPSRSETIAAFHSGLNPEDRFMSGKDFMEEVWKAAYSKNAREYTSNWDEDSMRKKFDKAVESGNIQSAANIIRSLEEENYHTLTEELDAKVKKMERINATPLTPRVRKPLTAEQKQRKNEKAKMERRARAMGLGVGG